jgi:site-specific DNA-methyltransferase (adenine-specific)
MPLSNIIDTIQHADCYEVLRGLGDKSVDLVLTDPPYGIGAARELPHNGWRDWGIKDWDLQRVNADAFSEIRRVSKHQIVWGGNYYADVLPPSSCWLVWDKGQRDFSLADGELAWCSFSKALRIFSYSRAAALQEGKSHPTQKPVPLFTWCLSLFAKPGWVVLDPFSGSGTTALACHALGMHFICVERDLEYVNISRNRLRDAQAQMSLFEVRENRTGGGSENSAQQAKPEMAEEKLSFL